MNVVDCHALLGSGVTWADPERKVNYDAGELLRQCDRAGIDRVCVLSPRTGDYSSANLEIARACERYRKRLIGFAVHNPEREAGMIREALKRDVSLGLRAVRSDGHPTRELLDAAVEFSLPVMYYPGGDQTPARWYHSMVSAYPGVRFILPHLGQYRSSPWWGHMEAIDLVKRYPNVFVETSGIGSLKYLEMAAAELPANRILLGSFAPELDPRVAIETIRLLKLTREKYAAITGGNLLRLLGTAN